MKKFEAAKCHYKRYFSFKINMGLGKSDDRQKLNTGFLSSLTNSQILEAMRTPEGQQSFFKDRRFGINKSRLLFNL